MNRDVALKVLKPDLDSESRAKQRFLREVRIISNLRHPNTVTIHDFGETESGLLYMVLEYIEGYTLQQLIEQHGPQPPEMACHLVTQILGSLVEAHNHGVVHRDLKPANIMVTELDTKSNFVKVLDFGVARLLRSEAEDLTNLGVDSDQHQLVGTPRYMSPEQVRGQQLSAASDLYSLGLVFYELMTGDKALDQDSITALISTQISPDPLELPSLDSVPVELEKMIRGLTAKPVSARYRDAENTLEEVRRIRNTLQGRAPESFDERAVPSEPPEKLSAPSTELESTSNVAHHLQTTRSRQTRERIQDKLEEYTAPIPESEQYDGYRSQYAGFGARILRELKWYTKKLAGWPLVTALFTVFVASSYILFLFTGAFVSDLSFPTRMLVASGTPILTLVGIIGIQKWRSHRRPANSESVPSRTGRALAMKIAADTVLVTALFGVAPAHTMTELTHRPNWFVDDSTSSTLARKNAQCARTAASAFKKLFTKVGFKIRITEPSGPETEQSSHRESPRSS